MTPKLWACLSIFQEADVIDETLRAANHWAEGFVVLDGAYKNFPEAGDGPSTDETLRIVERFRDSIAANRPFIIESKLWEDQVAKRNRYLELVPDDDWVMIVDADFRIIFYGNGYEEYKTNLTEQKWQAFQGRVIMRTPLGILLDYHWGNPFLFRKLPGLHYKFNHYSIYDADGFMFIPPRYRMKEIELAIFEAQRPADHIKKIRDYQINKQVEFANGCEPLWCDDCKIPIKFHEGEPLLCPKCGKGGLCNPPTVYAWSTPS
jgi:glycosyltransferase involved in cell wall biosynthesis